SEEGRLRRKRPPPQDWQARTPALPGRQLCLLASEEGRLRRKRPPPQDWQARTPALPGRQPRLLAPEEGRLRRKRPPPQDWQARTPALPGRQPRLLAPEEGRLRRKRPPPQDWQARTPALPGNLREGENGPEGMTGFCDVRCGKIKSDTATQLRRFCSDALGHRYHFRPMAGRERTLSIAARVALGIAG